MELLKRNKREEKMDRIRKKIENSKGETLAEALVASLLAGIALLALASMIMASHRMMDQSQKAVQQIYEDMNAIESRTISPQSGNVTITGQDTMQTKISVDIYKASNSGLASYAP